MAALAAAAAAIAPPAGAGAVAVPVAATEAAAAPPAGAAAAARPATNWRNVRVKWAKALFVLGCAAAALAFFAMNSTTADSRRVRGTCAPTDDAEAAALRAASKQLLVAAAAQVLSATTAVLVPERPVALFASLLAWLTCDRAPQVLRILVSCDKHVDAVLAIYYWVMWVAYLVGAAVSIACLAYS